MSTPEFAIHVRSIDALFDPLDVRPLAERALAAPVREQLLDEWERVRASRPQELRIHAPASERSDATEDAVRSAVRRDLRASAGPLRETRPLTRRERLQIVLGIILLLGCIAISAVLDRLSEDVLVEAIAQGIVVIGWVALWPPATYLALEVIPHQFNRRRYAEFADIDVRFAWTGSSFS